MAGAGSDELGTCAEADASPASCAEIVSLLKHGVNGPHGAARPPTSAWSAGGCGLPVHAAWKDESALTVHEVDIVETRREATPASLTPPRQMFVRNHLPAPTVRPGGDPMRWAVSFDGVLVPLTLTLKDLLAFGTETVTCVLQCAGNGRAFFADEPPGTPWAVGGAACVTFTGIPLRLVIAGLGGGVDGPGWLTATGGEPLPDDVAPSGRVERSVPLAALKHAILAFEMNGEPLQLTHGGPLRLVVPGYYGVNFVKYVRCIALTRQESDADIQRTNYRIRPAGIEAGPDQPSLWEMPAKSWIASARVVTPRRVEVCGVAFGGTSAPARVELTADGGQTFGAAQFDGPDLGPFAWRTFRATLHLPRGAHVLASRVTAADGSVQPAETAANAQGFGNNGWRGHALAIFVD